LAITCVIATAIGGTVMYLLIERPMTQLIKRHFYAN
jgi:hypothetical protein